MFVYLNNSWKSASSFSFFPFFLSYFLHCLHIHLQTHIDFHIFSLSWLQVKRKLGALLLCFSSILLFRRRAQKKKKKKKQFATAERRAENKVMKINFNITATFYSMDTARKIRCRKANLDFIQFAFRTIFALLALRNFRCYKYQSGGKKLLGLLVIIPQCSSFNSSSPI